MMANSNMYAASQGISLSEGWNIVSYPFVSPQDAMTVVQPLVDSDMLVKVIDEGGNSILKVFGNWTNNIGNFEPGEGYEIKVTEETYLSISEPASSSLRDETPERILLRNETSHFTPVWTGNSYNRMNFWVVGAEGLESGDEIAVFDGDNCVGVSVIEGQISQNNLLTIITSQDDGSGNGFTEDNEIRFRFWDAGEGTETEAEAPEFLDITTGNPIDTPTFKGNEDYGITWGAVKSYGDIDTSGAVDLKDAILALEILAGTNTNASVNLEEDVNDDEKIGLEEVVYILRIVANK